MELEKNEVSLYKGLVSGSDWFTRRALAPRFMGSLGWTESLACVPRALYRGLSTDDTAPQVGSKRYIRKYARMHMHAYLFTFEWEESLPFP